MTHRRIRSLAAFVAVLAILVGGCGATPLTATRESASAPAAGPQESQATEAADSSPPVSGGATNDQAANEQAGADWSRTPIELSDSQVAIVSDACAAAARQKLGEDEANLPTAVVDERGNGIATAILSDDAQAILCLARVAASGAATVDSVDRLATTAFSAQDGAKVAVTEMVGLDDPPGGRTLAFGRVGPDPAQVRLALPDQSTVVASRDNGWWLTWWPGTQRAAAIAGIDTNGAVMGSAEAPKGEVESRLGSASWWLDPTRPAPNAESTVIPVKILEEACASGTGGLDRLDPPTIDLTDTTVVVTLGIRRQPGPQDCQSNPPFSFDLELPEPLGNRTLLDGSENPPRDVSKPPSG